MPYFVYENWVAHGHSARVHVSDCSYCNNGQGIHPGASEQHGCWLGPFTAMNEAIFVAEKLGCVVSKCKRCKPK